MYVRVCVLLNMCACLCYFNKIRNEKCSIPNCVTSSKLHICDVYYSF